MRLVLYLGGALLLAFAAIYIPFAIQVAAVRSFHRTGPGWSFPSKVYSDWIDLTPGRPMPPEYLRAELEARGYTWAPEDDVAPGRYWDGGDRFIIGLRAFDYPDTHYSAERVTVVLGGSRVTDIRRTHRTGHQARLEPLLMGEWNGGLREERTFVPLDSIPKCMRDAVVASEDRRFYSHVGFDLRGIARALLSDMRGGGVRQGGSTLTQQLARNLFLNRKRTFERKVRETLIAMGLESRLSKQQILELYLNSAYFGQRGSRGIAGVEEAARFYFNKPASRLTLYESATLAAVIPAPNAFSPTHRPRFVRDRRDAILDIMASERFITRDEAAAARAAPLVVEQGEPPPARFPFFTDYARDFLAGTELGRDLESRGLRVFTTADPVWQEAAEEELDAGVGMLGQDGVQGAFCLAELRTGAVRALVGGRDYQSSTFNRAYQSKRQPGSSFKAVVYASAYDQNAGHSPWNPGSTVPDLPRDFGTGEDAWHPKNYENDYHPTVSLAKALAKSLNVATANLVEKVTPQHVVEYAERFGLGKLKAVPSIALGTSEVTLNQMMVVFTTIGSDGRLTPLDPIRAITDAAGRSQDRKAAARPQVLAPLTAHIMVEQLRNVVNFGTAFNLKSWFGFRMPAIGKTGTTNDEYDAWFMGATPDYAAGVWVGYDQPRSLGRSGSQAAVPVWARIMTRVTQGFPVHDFPAHADELEPATIDSYSGLLASGRCPSIIRTWFVRGTAPTRICDLAHLEPVLPDTTLGVGDTTFSSPFEVEPDQAPGTPPATPPSGEPFRR